MGRNPVDHSGEIINGNLIERKKEIDEKGKSVYEVRCGRCNKLFLSKYNNLSRVKSCGCYRKERMKTIENRGNGKDGTKFTILNSTPNSNKKNGKRKGVTFDKKIKKWKAEITFKKEYYYLGVFNTEREAIQMRISAEEILYKDTIEKWKAEGII